MKNLINLLLFQEWFRYAATKTFTVPPSAANALAAANGNHSIRKLSKFGMVPVCGGEKHSPNPPAQQILLPPQTGTTPIIILNGPAPAHQRNNPRTPTCQNPTQLNPFAPGGHTFITRCQILYQMNQGFYSRRIMLQRTRLPSSAYSASHGFLKVEN